MHLSSITLSMRMQYRKLFATTLSGVSFGLPAHLRTFDQVASEPSHAKSTCLYIHSFYVLVLRLIIFLSYVKMHFSYVKSKILCRWLDILRNYDHSRILITQKVHPLLPPGQPPPPSPRPRPATRPDPPPDPTHQPTLPVIPPGPPSHPARHHPARLAPPPHTQACLPRQPCQPRQPRRRCKRCDALVPSLSSCNGCVCGVQVNVQPPPIFYSPHLIFYIPHLKFYLPSPKFMYPI